MRFTVQTYQIGAFWSVSKQKTIRSAKQCKAIASAMSREYNTLTRALDGDKVLAQYGDEQGWYAQAQAFKQTRPALQATNASAWAEPQPDAVIKITPPDQPKQVNPFREAIQHLCTSIHANLADGRTQFMCVAAMKAHNRISFPFSLREWAIEQIEARVAPFDTAEKFLAERQGIDTDQLDIIEVYNWRLKQLTELASAFDSGELVYTKKEL